MSFSWEWDNIAGFSLGCVPFISIYQCFTECGYYNVTKSPSQSAAQARFFLFYVFNAHFLPYIIFLSYLITGYKSFWGKKKKKKTQFIQSTTKKTTSSSLNRSTILSCEHTAKPGGTIVDCLKIWLGCANIKIHLRKTLKKNGTGT